MIRNLETVTIRKCIIYLIIRFENTESLYLIQLCHLWLAWTSLIAYQRNYTYNPITLTANYLGSFLNYSVTM
jgi:hypothetical protein